MSRKIEKHKRLHSRSFSAKTIDETLWKMQRKILYVKHKMQIFEKILLWYVFKMSKKPPASTDMAKFALKNMYLTFEDE